MVSNIKKLCKARGVSVAELERSCGIPQRTIQRWDKSIPSVTKVKVVADYFGVTVDDILQQEQDGTYLVK